MTQYILLLRFWQVEYFLSAIMSFAICYLFWKTAAGDKSTFKRLWILLFLMLGLLFLLISLSGFVPMDIFLELHFSMMTFTGTVVFFIITALFTYLFTHYYR